MRLSKAVQRPRVGGKPLPKVFQRLPAIRRSEVTVIAGQSNAGKSLIALWHSVQWVKGHDLRGLYFSADGGELGMASRALCMTMMNLNLASAERLLLDKNEYALDAMADLDRLSWSFEDDLSYDNINDEMLAFFEMWGCAPDFVVVDNLTDVEGQADDEWATQRRALKALVQLARQTDSAVIVLAHTAEGEKEDPCPPKKAVLGKPSAKPAMIWTTADQGPRRPIAVVKDRNEKGADKTGRTAFTYWLDQETLHWREQ